MLAIIGGTGFDKLEGSIELKREKPDTLYGAPSSEIIFVEFNSSHQPVLFLPRHGENHTIAPHKINYRANLAALKLIGVSQVIAITAVGGIGKSNAAGSIVIADQLIDYTWGREHTFYDGTESSSHFMGKPLDHVDFSLPLSEPLRQRLIAAAKEAGIGAKNSGVYGVTQGPRLETAAEINRLDNDGVDIVGMTALPEAALARELGIDYALVCMVVNAAAGRSDAPITMDLIKLNLQRAQSDVVAMLEKFMAMGSG